MKEIVAIGYDPMGQDLAQAVFDILRESGYAYEVTPGSGEEDYPDIAWQTSLRVAGGGYHSGILICGTGLGMSITANKVWGIRAARCTDVYSVEKARRNAAANVLALGSEVTPPALARILLGAWLTFSFDSARSIPKIERITALAERADALR